MAPTLITTDILVRCVRYLNVLYFLFSSTFLWVCLGTPNFFCHCTSNILLVYWSLLMLLITISIFLVLSMLFIAILSYMQPQPCSSPTSIEICH